MPLTIFLLAHIVGDFYLQTSHMAQTKRSKMSVLILHSILYGLCIVPVVLLYGNLAQIIGFSLVAAGAHFLIDWLKIRLEKRFAGKSLVWLLFDQLIHIGVIIALASQLSNLNPIGQAVKLFINTIIHLLPSGKLEVRGIALLFLAYAVLWTPAAVLVKHVLLYIEGKKVEKEEASQEDVVKAGEMIGKLERIIVLSLCLLNAAASIAFVLTAKSIARYKQLEDKCFVERYLVGTLLSVALALTCYLAYRALLTV